VIRGGIPVIRGKAKWSWCASSHWHSGNWSLLPNLIRVIKIYVIHFHKGTRESRTFGEKGVSWMRKCWIAAVLLVMVVGGGTYFSIKKNPPLEIGTIGQNKDGTTVLVGITNHGFKDAKVMGVKVNHNETPEQVKMQVSNLLRGYAITGGPKDNLPEEISFKNIEDVKIQAGPTHAEQMESLDAGTASKWDRIYAVNVFHDKEVHRVIIEYQYFGMTFHETVKVHF
jgi:hypothetical protein